MNFNNLNSGVTLEFGRVFGMMDPKNQRAPTFVIRFKYEDDKKAKAGFSVDSPKKAKELGTFLLDYAKHYEKLEDPGCNKKKQLKKSKKSTPAGARATAAKTSGSMSARKS